MKYPYWVRHNDIDYAPGEDVPVEVEGGAKSPDIPVNASEGQNGTSNATPDNSKGAEIEGENKPSRSEYKKVLDKMNKAQLTEVVNANGVVLPDSPENVTNKNIVELILAKLYPEQ